MLTVRGHHLLCLHTYRGKGYSSAFVVNLDRIQAALQQDPGQPIRLTASPDGICGPCPHLAATGCDQEALISSHDRNVLGALAFREGQVLRADTALQTSAPRLQQMIDSYCGFCEWQPFCRTMAAQSAGT